MTDSLNGQTPCALITGATGFLGRQVVAAFSRAGWATAKTAFTRADPAQRVFRVDLNDEDAVAKVLDEQK